MKKCEKVLKSVKNDETILPFSCCPLVFSEFTTRTILLSPCDLLSRGPLCRRHFPGNYRHFPSPRRVRVVVNLGGVVKTLRRSNSLFFAIVIVFLVRKGPSGLGSGGVGPVEEVATVADLN